MSIHYHVDVENGAGTADLGFSYIADHELEANEVIRDDRGRTLVVVSASLLTTEPDPDSGLLFGAAQVKPAT